MSKQFVNWDKKETSDKKRNAPYNPNWVLAPTLGVPVVMGDQVDGVDYINVSKHGTTELGQKLAPGYPLEVRVKTPFGVIGTIRNFQDYITKTGYPHKLLSKPKLFHNEADLIYKLEPVDVPNYWALVAMVICERVKMSKTLKSLLRKLGKNVVFTSFNEIAHRDMWNKSIETSVSNSRMGVYLSIIRNIKIMIDENRFNDDNIRDFVMACMKDTSVDLYAGVACNVKIIDEPEVEESGSTVAPEQESYGEEAPVMDDLEIDLDDTITEFEDAVMPVYDESDKEFSDTQVSVNTDASLEEDKGEERIDETTCEEPSEYIDTKDDTSHTDAVKL